MDRPRAAGQKLLDILQHDGLFLILVSALSLLGICYCAECDDAFQGTFCESPSWSFGLSAITNEPSFTGLRTLNFALCFASNVGLLDLLLQFHTH